MSDSENSNILTSFLSLIHEIRKLSQEQRLLIEFVALKTHLPGDLERVILFELMIKHSRMKLQK